MQFNSHLVIYCENQNFESMTEGDTRLSKEYATDSGNIGTDGKISVKKNDAFANKTEEEFSNRTSQSNSTNETVS